MRNLLLWVMVCLGIPCAVLFLVSEARDAWRKLRARRTAPRRARPEPSGQEAGCPCGCGLPASCGRWQR